MKIQEAYEIVTGKRRGTTAEAEGGRRHAPKDGWSFHDWWAPAPHALRAA